MNAVSSGASQVVKTYRKRAARYDLTANLYYLMGFREVAYRKRAVQAIELQRGDTVVEIGCGTGLNFSHLQRVIGSTGKIIGVDLTDAMLAEARQRVESKGWSNVELVQADAAEYKFPEGIDGIISTFALSLSPHCADVIQNGSRALSAGGHWVVMDMKLPPRPLSRLLPLAMPVLRPFAISEEHIKRRPWEEISRAMYQNLEKVHLDEWYMGCIYIVSGEGTTS